MARRSRVAPGGLSYHAPNRAVARLPLFQKEEITQHFAQVMLEAMEQHPTRLLALRPILNHWHMILRPREDGELTRFLRWLTHTHTMRWQAPYYNRKKGQVRMALT